MKRFLNKNLIQNPCSMRWDNMQGSDERRFCEHCSKHVYNLSALSLPEAFFLIRFKKGNLCSRFLVNPDGSIRTRCISNRMRTLLSAAVAFFVGLVSLATATPAVKPEKDKTVCKVPKTPPVVSPGHLEMVGGDQILPLEGSRNTIKKLQKPRSR